MNKLVFKYLKENVKGVSIDRSRSGKYYTFYVDNACCEDYEFEIEKTTTKQELEEIINYCDSYDVNEHFSMWYGAHNGEPSDPRVLLNNCEEIEENLQELKYHCEIVLRKL